MNVSITGYAQREKSLNVTIDLKGRSSKPLIKPNQPLFSKGLIVFIHSDNGPYNPMITALHFVCVCVCSTRSRSGGEGDRGPPAPTTAPLG